MDTGNKSELGIKTCSVDPAFEQEPWLKVQWTVHPDIVVSYLTQLSFWGIFPSIMHSFTIPCWQGYSLFRIHTAHIVLLSAFKKNQNKPSCELGKLQLRDLPLEKAKPTPGVCGLFLRDDYMGSSWKAQSVIDSDPCWDAHCSWRCFCFF